MAKRKKNKMSQSNKPSEKASVVMPNGISEDELQHIIARAIIEAKDMREEQNRKLADSELKEWRSAIGYIEYSDKNKVWRGIKTFFNRLKCFIKLCYVPKKYVHGDRASFAIMKFFLQSFFSFSKFLLTLTAIVFFVYGIALFFITTPTISWASNVCLIIFGISVFLLARMFRMASIEIDKIEDRNYVFGMFASVTSIVSIIIAVIAVVKGS